MFYMGGDNNLAPIVLADIDELEQIGSTDKVHFTAMADVWEVIESDFMNFPVALTDGEGNLVAPMMHIGKHPEEGVQSHLSDPSAVLYDLDGFNSASPANLTTFIKWSVNRFPAKRYALVIYGHGNSWLPGRMVTAVVSDDWEGDGDAMYIHEVESAIKNSGVHLDLLDFMSCNMASIEVIFQLRNTADYICASQKVMMGGPDGCYTAMASYLTSNPGANANQAGRKFVDTYINGWATIGEYTVTKSLIRTDKIESVAGCVNKITPLLSDPAIVTSEGLNGMVYEPIRFFQDVDLGNLTNVLSYNLQDVQLKNNLADVRSTLNEAVIYNRVFVSPLEQPEWSFGSRGISQGEDVYVDGVSGLNIFMPTLNDWTIDTFGYYNSIAFNNVTGWSWVINHAYAGIPCINRAPGGWGAELTWSTGVDLDLWVFEPNAYGEWVASSPCLGTRGINGQFSGDSHWTWISAESYQTNQYVIEGYYFFMAVYYMDNFWSNNAYCMLKLTDNPHDTQPLNSNSYYISANSPVDPDFGPGVVFFGCVFYNPADGLWYFAEEDRSGQGIVTNAFNGNLDGFSQHALDAPYIDFDEIREALKLGNELAKEIQIELNK